MTTTELIAPPTKEIERLEELAKVCGLTTIQGQGQFASAFAMAGALRQMRDSITPAMMRDIMELRGTRLGFRTDRDDPHCKHPPYGTEVVKDCLIEGTLRGARIVGNEINIIGGNCYLTLEFYRRIMAEMPGLTDLALMPGAPMPGQSGKTAYVPYIAVWRYFDKPGRMERLYSKCEKTGKITDNRIPVRVNEGMIVDAILGKAERKMRAAIYNHLTGTHFSDADLEDLGLLSGGPVPALEHVNGDAPADGEAQPAPDSRTASQRLADRFKKPPEPMPKNAAEAETPEGLPPQLSRMEGETGKAYVERVEKWIGQAQTIEQVTQLLSAAELEREQEAIAKSDLLRIIRAANVRTQEIDPAPVT